MSSGNILGTYDLEKKVEDTLILLETTMKNYGDPNRAVVIEDAILQLVSAKQTVDPSDRFALMTFGETSEVLLEFKDWSPDAFKDQLYNNAKILGTEAYLVDAMAEGFQTLAMSMMKLFEGKTFRMVIITEGGIKNREDQPNWRELIDKCDKIGLFIDIIEISDRRHQNFLQSIASGTKGEFISCPLSDVENFIPSLAPKKKLMEVNQSKADKNMTAFLDIIAQPLTKMETQIKNPKDLLNFVTSDDDSTKCAICHSDTCMICKGPSYACGAYCPNCNRFFHEHCFAAWAENSEDTPPSIGKCPICFALLKVPGAMYRVKVLQGRLKGKFDPPKEKFRAKKVPAKNLGRQGAFIGCAWCHNVFDPSEDIMKCGNPACGAYYHFDCFNEMVKHTKGRCRICDGEQARRMDANPHLQRVV